MTPDEQRLCDVLSSVCELNSDESIEAYVTTIKALRGSKNEDVLRCLLRCLRDADAGEVQYELVEASEAFPQYVPILLEEGLRMYARAPTWFTLMFQSILNTPTLADDAIARIHRMSASGRAGYRQILSEIAEDTPQYRKFLERLS